MFDRVQLGNSGHGFDLSQFQQSVDRIVIRPRPPTLTGRMSC